MPQRLLLTGRSLHLRFAFTKINAKALPLNITGSKHGWPGWKPVYFVVCSAVRCDQESPAGCRGSRSRDPAGDLLRGWSELCLPHACRVFL